MQIADWALFYLSLANGAHVFRRGRHYVFNGNEDDFLKSVPTDVKLLSARQVGLILGISESKVRMLTDSGELKPVAVGKRSVRYRLSDVYAYSRSLK